MGAGRYSLQGLVVFGMLVCVAATAQAQYFGRNKVQYEDFDFRILYTGRFDVYHYPVAEDAARDAERAHPARFDRRFVAC